MFEVVAFMTAVVMSLFLTAMALIMFGVVSGLLYLLYLGFQEIWSDNKDVETLQKAWEKARDAVLKKDE